LLGQADITRNGLRTLPWDYGDANLSIPAPDICLSAPPAGIWAYTNHTCRQRTIASPSPGATTTSCHLAGKTFAHGYGRLDSVFGAYRTGRVRHALPYLPTHHSLCSFLDTCNMSFALCLRYVLNGAKRAHALHAAADRALQYAVGTTLRWLSILLWRAQKEDQDLGSCGCCPPCHAPTLPPIGCHWDSTTSRCMPDWPAPHPPHPTTAALGGPAASCAPRAHTAPVRLTPFPALTAPDAPQAHQRHTPPTSAGGRTAQAADMGRRDVGRRLPLH